LADELSVLEGAFAVGAGAEGVAGKERGTEFPCGFKILADDIW
jgi:hypothetical protein